MKWLLACVGTVMLMAGCASPRAPHSAAAARLPAGHEIGAVQQVAGIEAVVRPDGWAGPAPIHSAVTLVKITLINHSTVPISVRYADFSLISAQGHRYAALPPFRLRGTPDEPIVDPGYEAITSPQFEASGFEVAPFYSPIYPDLPVSPEPMYADPIDYDARFEHWRAYNLPTRAMRERALPEGELRPGGTLGGFLYFEPVSAGAGPVDFRMVLIAATTGQPLGAVRVQLFPKSPG